MDNTAVTPVYLLSPIRDIKVNKPFLRWTFELRRNVYLII